ncbi:MAG: hypothetical protein O3C43_11700 [Verrucomicrobia bacterium]|nr:hypothetical protein [Verrucomicrobiota bacterium]MDA1067157.1 hypothetical protein [Verrucomicrobiota bacterium]
MKRFYEEIEKELGLLKPAAPSEALKTKIESALEEPQSTHTISLVRFWPGIALATAACLIFVFAISISRTSNDVDSGNAASRSESTQISQPVAKNSYIPLEAEQRLMKAFDDGIVFTDGHDPVRKLRYQFIDTLTMLDKNDGSVFTMEIPREEILFVPVTLL